MMAKLRTLARQFEMWMAPIGGAIIWLIHFLLIYVISEFGCVGSWGQIHALGINIVSWLVIGVTILCVVPAIQLTRVSHRYWASHQKSLERNKFDRHLQLRVTLFRGGALMGWLFILIILFEAIPVFFYLGGC